MHLLKCSKCSMVVCCCFAFFYSDQRIPSLFTGMPLNWTEGNEHINQLAKKCQLALGRARRWTRLYREITSISGALTTWEACLRLFLSLVEKRSLYQSLGFEKQFCQNTMNGERKNDPEYNWFLLLQLIINASLTKFPFPNAPFT